MVFQGREERRGRAGRGRGWGGRQIIGREIPGLM